MRKPPTALSIWLEGDQLFLELPAIEGHTAHTIKVPTIQHVYAILQARRVSSTIATRGDPTQDQILVRDFLKKSRKKPSQFTARQKALAFEVLKRLGLT